MRHNIIFLDVDGVLNSLRTTRTFGNWTFVDDYLIERLKRIVDEAEALVVLTSTWNEGYWHDSYREEFLALVDELLNHGIEVYGCTRYLHDRRIANRALDICEWINLNFDIIKNFVIIDDQRMWYENNGPLESKVLYGNFYENLVKTDPRIGLQEEDVLLAISILNSRPDSE